MNVVEIFDSIDGEGIFAGGLATFVRLAGCNLRCEYCDTPYALGWSDGNEMSVQEITNRVKSIGNRHVTLTGGEPLIHRDVAQLIDALARNGHIINIETNGSVDIEPFRSSSTIITMDYKTASSGEQSKMRIENISELRERDVLKIVCKESDFDGITKLLKDTNPKCYVYISPIFGAVEPEALVKYLQSLRNEGVNTEKFRVQVQLHKIIWNPDKRGV